MARARGKGGGKKKGWFKRKKMGKGYTTVRTEPVGTRPVLRITDPVEPAAKN
ncbi:MAG: hypothetical protein R3F29_04385 [Planctomycetota bacterium]